MVKVELDRRRTARTRDVWKTWLTRILPVSAALLATYLAILGVQGATTVAWPRPFAFPDRPENYGMEYERIDFKAAVDGVLLAGWLFPDPAGEGRIVVLVPGYRSHKAHLLREYEHWLAQEVGVLAYDPRGAGESGRAPGTFGDDERRDVAGAVAFAKSRGYSRIALFGTSLGGAAAIAEGAGDPAVRAIITDGAPSSIAGGLTDSLARERYPLPKLGARAVMLALSIQVGHLIGEGDAVRHVAQISPRPLLLIHGGQDHVVPQRHQAILAAAANPAHTAVLTFEDADHLSVMERSPHRLHRTAYEAAVMELLRRGL